MPTIRETINALRCMATPWNGKDVEEVCKGCPYLVKKVPAGKLEPLLKASDGMLWSCNVDKITSDAADHLEHLYSTDLISRRALEDFAMTCIGGMVTMQQIHKFPDCD